jgi:peptidoglycan/LPS O-acetylase OafA/YrhL
LWLKNDTAAITGSTWMRDLWPQSASLLDALSQGLWGVFFSSSTETSYNPVLWTMKFELIGSLIVFAIVLLFGKAKHRWVIYLLALCATFKTWYLAFVIGMILADLYANKKFPFIDTAKRYGWLVLILLIGLFVGGYPYSIPEGSVYSSLQIAGMDVTQNHSFFLSIAAGLLIIAVISLKPISRLFGSRPIALLGKYSFSIYLTHMAVLFTIGAGVFLLIHQAVGFHAASAISILVSLIIVAPVAYLFEKYVDSPSIRISGAFAEWLFGGLKKKN